jgi:hypothetical protein
MNYDGRALRILEIFFLELLPLFSSHCVIRVKGLYIEYQHDFGVLLLSMSVSFTYATFSRGLGCIKSWMIASIK